MKSTFTEVAPGIHAWPDTCNVYVIKDGSAAILIDLGDGSVLDAMPQIGVTQVDWVLYTHHHREQCQGRAKLADHAATRGVKVAAPANERELFGNWKLGYSRVPMSLFSPGLSKHSAPDSLAGGGAG